MTVSIKNRIIQRALRGKLPSPGKSGGARLVTGFETWLHTSTAPDAIYFGQSMRRHTPFWRSLEIRHDDDLHILTVASSGEGKGRTAINTNMRYPGSLALFDINGEAAQIQYLARRKIGDVIACDPFAKIADNRDGEPLGCEGSYNPLDELLDSTTPADDCLQYAEALFPEVAEKDPYWRGVTKRVVAGLMGYVLLEVEGGTICEILDLFRMSEEGLDSHLDHILEYDDEESDLHRLIKAAARTLRDLEPQARRSVKEIALNELAIFDSDQMRRVMTSGPILFSEIKAVETSIFVVLPEDRMASHGRWLRLMATAALTALSRDRTVPRHRVLLVLDEFANLGRLESLTKAISFLRDQHVKLWLLTQDIGQLEKLYGTEVFSSIAGNCGAISVLGCGDLRTASWASEMTGKMTVKSKDGHKVASAIRPVLTADEVRRFCSRQRGCGLLFVRGCNAIPFVRRGYDQKFRAGEYEPLRQYRSA